MYEKTWKSCLVVVVMLLAGLFVASTKAEARDTYTGWRVIDGEHYYYSYGQKVLGWESALNTIKGKRYAFNTKTGKRETGWQSKGNDWYWCDPKTGVAASGWKQIGKKWYYFNVNINYMMTGVRTINSKDYYFGKNGAMRKGWQKPFGKDWKTGISLTEQKAIC